MLETVLRCGPHKKQTAGHIWPVGLSLPTLILRKVTPRKKNAML